MQLLPFYEVEEDGTPEKRPHFNPVYRFVSKSRERGLTPSSPLRKEEKIARRLDPHYIEELPTFDIQNLLMRARKQKGEKQTS